MEYKKTLKATVCNFFTSNEQLQNPADGTVCCKRLNDTQVYSKIQVFNTKTLL